MPPKKSPSKSPAKVRPPPAQPTRTTPRRSPKAPVRLGQNDNWGSTTPTKWVSAAPDKKEEEEKYQERVKFVKEMNAKTDAKKSLFTFAKYKKFMDKYMWPATIAQTVVLTVVGFVIGTLIKSEEITMIELSGWAGWGVITSTTSLPYLKLLNAKTFAASPKKDAVLKALFNQLTFSQVLNALFLTYWALLKGTDPMAAVKTKMLEQAKLCVGFWLPSDLVNMYLIPPQAQILWNATMGIVWSAMLAYLA